MHRNFGNSVNALSRALTIVIVVVVILILAVGGYVALSAKTTTSTTSTQQSSTSTSSVVSSVSTSSSASSLSTSVSAVTTSSSSSVSSTATASTTSSSSSSSGPTTLTYETLNTPENLDPDVAYFTYDQFIIENVYEPLLQYPGANSTFVVPWLASNYSVSPDGTSANFTLRSGIKFADGETLNSTAVYFSLNRLLIIDGSTTTTHGTQGAFIMQQLLNTSLSSSLSAAQNYTSAWANEVLNQDFVQITGPLTFTLHIINPNTALPYLLAGTWADILAPDYVMKTDLSLWSTSSNGYTLPYPTPGGNATQMMNEYFMDEVATCNAGATPKGCGATYIDSDTDGSLASTGPYIIENFSSSTNDFVLKANPNYWGGSLAQKIQPQFTTIDINYVPNLATREVDLENAAKSGEAFTIDLPNSNLYDFANRTAWLNSGVLSSVVPGISLYGPYTGYTTNWVLYSQNVTNPYTGLYYKFQPFADVRLRLAFADAVNVSDINVNENDNLGQVAINGIPPGLPPTGAHNASIVPRYSFNLTAVQNLLLSAMENPMTNFNFYNGTAAPPGYFNNTFGCGAAALSANGGTCANPVQQNIQMTYYTGDSVDQALLVQIATAINNVSSTYNMGLTVSVVPVPIGQMITLALSDNLYMFALQTTADYPWVNDFLAILYSSALIDTAVGLNFSQFTTLYNQAVAATSTGNITGVISVSNQMNEIANQEVFYLWTIYPETINVFTSNIKGFFYNPATLTFYFASLYA
jgi:ABC-type transport system substrate-binding protein